MRLLISSTLLFIGVFGKYSAISTGDALFNRTLVVARLQTLPPAAGPLFIEHLSTYVSVKITRLNS